MIVDVFRREGEWVDASEPVARVVRLDVLRAEIKLPATLALNDLVGTNATFIPKLDSPSLQQSYPGKVVFVYPEANPISADVRVWIEIENQDLKLIPGLLGKIEVNPHRPEPRSTANTSRESVDQ
jgi:multidrug efflux pump subunit AcrA (membrane-fusion protein)